MKYDVFYFRECTMQLLRQRLQLPALEQVPTQISLDTLICDIYHITRMQYIAIHILCEKYSGFSKGRNFLYWDQCVHKWALTHWYVTYITSDISSMSRCTFFIFCEYILASAKVVTSCIGTSACTRQCWNIDTWHISHQRCMKMNVTSDIWNYMAHFLWMYFGFSKGCNFLYW